MKKYILFIIMLFIPFICVKAEGLETYSDNIFLYNLNDKEVLLEQNQNEKIYIASLTKIMTVLVSIENIDNLDKKVAFPTIDYNSIYDYSQVGFTEGEIISYRDLLNGALLASGADATEALALLVSDDKADFIDLMNKTAKKIGLNNTSFSNTMGKDDVKNYSTVSDVFELLSYALKNKEFYKIFTTLKYEMSNDKTVYSTLYYYNKKANLNTDGIIGVKTGYTNGAGLCMASLFKKNNINYILITTNAPSDTDEPLQVMDAVNITNYYYNNYEYINLIEEGDLITTLKLAPFNVKEEIYSKETIKDYLLKDKEITYDYEGKTKITGKNKIGDTLGYYIINYNGKEVNRIEVKVEDNFKNKLWIFIAKYIWYFIGIIAFYITFKIIFKKKKRRN